MMTRSILRKALVPTLACAAFANTGMASEVEEFSSLRDALQGGQVHTDLRLRFESVDQPDANLDGSALTLRTRLSYTTGALNGVHAKITFEDTAALSDEDEYNTGVNGKGTEAKIIDPENTEVDEFFLSYGGVENTDITFGRQVINFDNQRHIGAVGWRQNRQTFDALRVTNTSIENLTLNAAYVMNVQGVKGNTHDSEMASVLLHGTYALEEIGKVSAYVYSLNYEGASTGDTTTFGVRLDGGYVLNDDMKLLYEAEVASQSDSGDNTLSYTALYLHAVVGLKYKSYVAKLGMESRGSDDGTQAFITPLGTNHKFEGWTDVYLGGNGAKGFVDTYVMLGAGHSMDAGKLGGKLFFHSFKSDEDSDDLGTEIDVLVTFKPSAIEGLSFGAKYASLSEGDDNKGVDTDKFAVWTGYSF